MACALKGRFVQRSDLHARQLGDGRYVCIRRPLSTRHLIDHLGGRNTLGAYVLDESSHARFLVLDADDDAGWQALRTLADDLQRELTTLEDEIREAERKEARQVYTHHPESLKKLRQKLIADIHREAWK